MNVGALAAAEARVARARGRERGVDALVGPSMVMAELRAWMRRVAASPCSTVLLNGESGSGKNLAARAIHRESQRAAAPLLTIDCSTLPEGLLESELFGHERGAFTDARQQRRGLFEQAGGGTVLLDEIGEISAAMQSKLLRVIEERIFRRVGGSEELRPDIRIIAATNRDLREAVRAGRFREDLYYRLAVLEITLPPLRDRLLDLQALAELFIEQFNVDFGRKVEGLGACALETLRAHSWPGNVRELRNTLERAMLLAEGPRLEAVDLRFMPSLEPALQPGLEPGSLFTLPSRGLDLARLERHLVMQALERSRGNRTQAAALLGLSRDQIRYRIAKYALEEPGSAAPSPGGSREDETALGGRGVATVDAYASPTAARLFRCS